MNKNSTIFQRAIGRMAEAQTQRSDIERRSYNESFRKTLTRLLILSLLLNIVARNIIIANINLIIFISLIVVYYRTRYKRVRSIHSLR